MTLIKELFDKAINRDDINESNPGYRKRSAARAILFDKLNRIAILNVSKNRYHKLPGGGIEENEEPMTALKRELLEEVGVHAKVLSEVGIIIEHKHIFRQTSYCFAAKVIGEHMKPSFTEKEINDGFILEWYTLDDAIKIMENDIPQNVLGEFIRERDLTFIKHFKNSLNKGDV